MEIVVARYREPVGWVEDLRHPTLIFNKNRDEDHLFKFNLPNKGRETDTFVGYIVEAYDRLPEYVAFLQGNPFDHCPEAVSILNGFGSEAPFEPLGATYYRDNEAILEGTIDWAGLCGIEVNSPIKFISGMQCVVSRDLIRMRSRASYEKIHGMVSQEIDFNCHTAYYFEYLWPTILGFNEIMEIGPCRC